VTFDPTVSRVRGLSWPLMIEHSHEQDRLLCPIMKFYLWGVMEVHWWFY